MADRDFRFDLSRASDGRFSIRPGPQSRDQATDTKTTDASSIRPTQEAVINPNGTMFNNFKRQSSSTKDEPELRLQNRQTSRKPSKQLMTSDEQKESKLIGDRKAGPSRKEKPSSLEIDASTGHRKASMKHPSPTTLVPNEGQAKQTEKHVRFSDETGISQDKGRTATPRWPSNADLDDGLHPKALRINKEKQTAADHKGSLTKLPKSENGDGSHDDGIPAFTHDRIVVEVGERSFVTSSVTLKKSGLFRKILSRPPHSPRSPTSPTHPKQVSVDNDPDLFVDILRYLRTAMYPLFWTQQEGFDQARYATLRDQARFYVLPKLEDWIAAKRYLAAVTVVVRHRKTNILERQEYLRRHVLQGANVEMAMGAAVTNRELVWTCPADRAEHDGDSLMCEVNGCCGSMLASAKDKPEQRVLKDVTKLFTSETSYTVNDEVLWSWKD